MEGLQELCLRKIVTSIDRFNRAYSISDNKDLRRGFKFLQKGYSNDLALQLGRRHFLQEKHADLIFNKHLTHLETHWLSNFSWKAIFEIFKKIGPNLNRICFNHPKYDLPWKDVFCHTPDAKIVICDDYCNDDVLRCIAEYCPRLETLTIGDSHVTDDGLKHFWQKWKINERCLDETQKRDVPCPRLKEIYIDDTSVGDESITQLLKNLPSLEKIDYRNLPLVLHEMHKNNFDSLEEAEKYNLIYLDLTTDFGLGEKYDDVLKVCVTVCPKVKNFFCTIFKAEHLNMCSVLSNVEYLELHCAEDSGVEVSDFLKQRGGKLTSLSLSNCTVSLSALGMYCPDLEDLTTDGVTIQYNEKDPLPVFYNLETFSIRNFHLCDSATLAAICRILTYSPALESLEMESFRSLTAEVKTAILECCVRSALKNLQFTGCVDKEFIKSVLLTCSTLKCLYFMGPLTEELRRIASTLPNRPELSV